MLDLRSPLTGEILALIRWWERWCGWTATARAPGLCTYSKTLNCSTSFSTGVHETNHNLPSCSTQPLASLSSCLSLKRALFIFRARSVPVAPIFIVIQYNFCNHICQPQYWHQFFPKSAGCGYYGAVRCRYDVPEIALNCGSMLRDCIRNEQVTECAPPPLEPRQQRLCYVFQKTKPQFLKFLQI